MPPVAKRSRAGLIKLFLRRGGLDWIHGRSSLKAWGDNVAMDRDGGRLSVALPPSRGTVEVYYRPRTFVVGCFLSALACLALWLLRRRR